MAPILRTVVLCGCVVAALTACGEGTVSASDIEQEAETQFSQQFPVDSVDCPEDLPAEEGASTTCILESEGSEFEMAAEITSVDGETVNFDFELTAEVGGADAAREDATDAVQDGGATTDETMEATAGDGDAVAGADVASEADRQFSQQFPVDSVDCPDDLPAEQGATTLCVLESEGVAYEMTVEVTGVDDAGVDLDFELTAEL
jgi:hypothetical protein